MKVICCQLDIVWENKQANHDKVRRLLAQAAPEKDSLVILPEMFSVGFSMNVSRITDTRSQATQQFAADLASEFGVYLMAGVVTTAASGKGRNECVVYSPAGEELARYAKIHPFRHGGETDHYEAGNQIVTFEWNGFTVAPFICYDLRFPEIFRAAMQCGANLFTVIASWPAPRLHHWTALLHARAIENQAYAIGVNRCGNDPQLQYSGGSVIVHPLGKALVEAGNIECTISADVSVEEVNEYRHNLTFLRDIRPEFLRMPETQI
jgi:predicted amidohydrolase